MASAEHSKERLVAFQQAYQNLQLLPLLTQEELDKFWVEYGTAVLERLEQSVLDSTPGNDKIIFTGHRGCGKSTLLAEFCRQIEGEYFVVMFSIAELIEMSDVNHVNILFAIAVQLMEAAENQKVKIKPSIKKAFYRWFGEQTRLETSTIEADLEVKSEVGGGLDAIFKFLFQIKSILKANAIIRDEIKTKFERQISDLIDRINEIAAAIRADINKPILVVIDDLDKLDLELVEKIYCNNINPLFQPEFGIIYTIPIAAIRNLTFLNVIKGKTNKIELMRVAKFFPKRANRDPDAKPVESEVAVFQEILRKRLPPELIEPEIEQQIILNSGGVLRELMRLASLCCSKCLVQIRRAIRKQDPETPLPDIKINADVLALAVADLRIDFATPLGRLDYDLLKRVYQDNEPQNAEDQRFLDFLHGLYILEYRNAQLWYDLHPIVTDLLKEQVPDLA